jgi:hypothetical protein
VSAYVALAFVLVAALTAPQIRLVARLVAVGLIVVTVLIVR